MDFVALDFETTGLGSSALGVEIGLVRVQGGTVVDSFNSLIYQTAIGEMATKIHGITVEDLIDAPKAKDLLNAVSAFTGGLPIVMHNAPFDLMIANNSGLISALEHSYTYCSLHLARRVFSLPVNKLGHLASELGLKQIPSHRAIDDALTTAELTLRMLSEKRIPSLHDLYASQGLWPGRVTADGYKPPKQLSKGTSHLTASLRQAYKNSIRPEEWMLHPEWEGVEVCFTGTLQSFNREEAHLLAVKMGADPKGSVNRTTKFVIVGVDAGLTKLNKLEGWHKKGYEIFQIDEEEFRGYVEEALSLYGHES